MFCIQWGLTEWTGLKSVKYKENSWTKFFSQSYFPLSGCLFTLSVSSPSHKSLIPRVVLPKHSNFLLQFFFCQSSFPFSCLSNFFIHKVFSCKMQKNYKNRIDTISANSNRAAVLQLSPFLFIPLDNIGPHSQAERIGSLKQGLSRFICF